uniref:PCNA-interacting partner n=2 Tax=Petromyzon marinus TaxID=7757 RepID=A0AAJ7SU41_PETMA|nr:PCNA-interacting partner isoform X1 [Petromyzon marinus]
MVERVTWDGKTRRDWLPGLEPPAFESKNRMQPKARRQREDPVWRSSMCSPEESVRALLTWFRQCCPGRSAWERCTLLGPPLTLVAVQLAMAQLSKQAGGEFEAPLGEALLLRRWIFQDKLALGGLAKWGAETPPERFGTVRQEYMALLKGGNLLDLADVLLAYQKGNAKQGDRHIGQPVPSPTELLEIVSGAAMTSRPLPSTPGSQLLSYSRLKAGLRSALCSYLSLLVNTKDDLSLSLVLNLPERGLDHDAFTALKRAARAKHTSLLLAATSFVRRLELGGRSRAVELDNPLLRYAQGFGDLVQFLDQLVELLAAHDTEPRRACERVLTAVRLRLLRLRVMGHAVGPALDEAAEELSERLREAEVMPAVHGSASPAQPRLHAINHGTAMSGRAALALLRSLLDYEAALAGGLHGRDGGWDPVDGGGLGPLPCLALFRSPEQASEPSPEPLVQRVHRRCNRVQTPTRPGWVRSQFACTYREEFPCGLDLALRDEEVEGGEGGGGEQRPPRPCGSASRRILCASEPALSSCPELSVGLAELQAASVDQGSSSRTLVRGKRPPPSPRRCNTGSEPQLKHPRGLEVEKRAVAPTSRQARGRARQPTKAKLLSGQMRLTSFFRM